MQKRGLGIKSEFEIQRTRNWELPPTRNQTYDYESNSMDVFALENNTE